MEDTDSTEVVYKIRQWSLAGAAIVPVLTISSRVFWLELDDKAVLDSYTVSQEDILCDVLSQKCSAAWQSARGERLTVAIIVPGRQDADDWLNFMLSQKNLWSTFTTRSTLTEKVSEQVFSKERCNGGERRQEHVRETKKQSRRLKMRELSEKQSYTSIKVSWTLKILEDHGVMLEGGRLQANLNNGGELESKLKASKKCSISTGAMKKHLSNRTQSPFQASMHHKDCSTVRVGQRM